MRPVSDRFLNAITGSHTMFARARIVTPGQSGTDPDGTVVTILDGDVEIDSTADIRSTLDLTTDGTNMWPTNAADLLTPYANEIFVERGIVYGDGIREIVYLSYFRITTIEQDEAPNGPIRISGQDRMAAVVEGRLTSPRQYQAGTTLGAIFTELVTDVLPDAIIEWDDATNLSTLGRTAIVEEDRFAFLADLVTAAAKIWYFDHRGILVIKSPPEPTTPVFEVSAGEGGVLVSMGRRLTREGVYNAVVATGEAADTTYPARAVVVDDNPNSPTYWYGTFGKVPRFYSSPLLATDAQAQAAARSLLVRAVGLPYAVDLSAVPNPALEPYDPIRINYSATRRAEIHVIDKLTVPLTAAGALTATTREQQLVITAQGE